jgi:hypothetical protein
VNYITKKITDPLKIEWDEKKGKVTRTCKVCQKSFQATHWKQTVCSKEKGNICHEYSFRYAHVRASHKRWDEIVKAIQKAGLKPSFAFNK